MVVGWWQSGGSGSGGGVVEGLQTFSLLLDLTAAIDDVGTRFCCYDVAVVGIFCSQGQEIADYDVKFLVRSHLPIGGEGRERGGGGGLMKAQ